MTKSKRKKKAKRKHNKTVAPEGNNYNSLGKWLEVLISCEDMYKMFLLSNKYRSN